MARSAVRQSQWGYANHRSDGARLKEHPYIEFINRVQMAASGAKISGTALFNNEGKALAQPSRCGM